MEKSKTDSGSLAALLASNEAKVLDYWTSSLLASRAGRRVNIREADVKRQARDFLAALRAALESNAGVDIQNSGWEQTRGILADISRDQAREGASPSEVATFIFSLKEALFHLLQTEFASDPDRIAREVWNASSVLDRLGLLTTDIALKSREETIIRQQKEMLELSTPVVKLWGGILALPLIGTLDSERTQIVMENLLDEIVRTEAGIAIIDITGVPMVDTLVAQHLLKTVAAARLMGAECIISGIRPQIASTIVHLGVDLGGVSTKATLADAFAMALRRCGLAVSKSEPPRNSAGQ
ncbi:MAG TPA: STAS domain-containing protein [Bryobacteraceae bacterium]|jgi:rsbT co-antagonist protein RsbR|nr:STAS domain-containing protein [Bryobacteraceae bacterium]